MYNSNNKQFANKKWQKCQKIGENAGNTGNTFLSDMFRRAEPAIDYVDTVTAALLMICQKVLC